MKDEKRAREDQAGTPAKDEAQGQKKTPRAHRLKLALRENLKRRKSQARGRSGMAAASANEGEAAPDEGGGKKPSE